MSDITPTALEGAIQRYGDDLYRLALLLTREDARAAAALRGTMRRLVDLSPAALDEPAMIAALVAALPSERRHLRRRQLPAWAQWPAGRGEPSLIAALAQLPRRQRLALGLTIVCGLEAQEAAAVLGGDEQHFRALIRDILRALAPQALPGLAPADLDPDNAPETCRPTRAALALGADLAHDDPATRGHLALCDACRDVEAGWARLRATVEQALRGALRTSTLSEQLAEDLRAAGSRAQLPAQPSPLASQHTRLATVAVIVLAIVVLLVFPHRFPGAVSTGANDSAAPSAAPHALVKHALDRLYAPPDGSGVWHGRWEIRWNFAAGSYAVLNADAWIDRTTSRHRVQLAHHDGGGPFEFELADGSGSLWYATTANYAPSLYPPSLFDADHLQAHLRLTPAAAEQMLRARLASGAWDLAAAYLRQARDARELRSWGRQRGENGATIEVIGFDGFSPLAPPPDAPDSAAPATILLLIDSQTGALQEVRELIGPEGGERTSRTTWRFVQSEWLTADEDRTAAFDLRRAWNGAGDFEQARAQAADPTLPLVAADRVMSLVQLFQNNPPWIPASVPAGATHAIALALDDSPDVATSNMLVYSGPGRSLVIAQRALMGGDQLKPGGEVVSINGVEFTLRPLGTQGYRAQTIRDAPLNGTLITQLSAHGYTRAELIDVLRTLGPPTVESYRAQAPLFAGPKPVDPAAFEALLGALASPELPPNGQARHFVEQTFKRQAPLRDPLPDPYHLPPYGGRPAMLFTDNWVRAAGDGQFENKSTEHSWDGTVYGRQYLGPAVTWYYDRPPSRAYRMRTSSLPLMNRINQDQTMLFDILTRGDERLVTLPDGTQVISSSRTLFADPVYQNLFVSQQPDPLAVGAPFLLDIGLDATITTWVYPGPDGRPKRIETWAVSRSAPAPVVAFNGDGNTQPFAPPAGLPRDATLLESWELVSEEQVPADRVPAGTFDTEPPSALFLIDSTTDAVSADPIAPHTITISEALKIASTPLWYLPPGDENGSVVVETIVEPPQDNGAMAGEEQRRRQVIVPASVPLQNNRFMGNPFSDPFEDALWRGLALRLNYLLLDGEAAVQNAFIYEGPATTFGTYLQALPPSMVLWQSSTPARIHLSGRQVDGWRMVTGDGTTWTLFEVDGTLVVMQTIDDVQRSALTRLQRLPVTR